MLTSCRSNQDVVNQAVLEISDRQLYDLSRDRAVAANGPLDNRMGISSKNGVCQTCGEALLLCNGHFGHVKLALPAFHIGYFKMITNILHDICKVRYPILLARVCMRSNRHRIAVGFFCLRMSNEPFSDTSANRTLTTSVVHRYARRYTFSAGRLGHAIIVERSMGLLGRRVNIHSRSSMTASELTPNLTLLRNNHP